MTPTEPPQRSGIEVESAYNEHDGTVRFHTRRRDEWITVDVESIVDLEDAIPDE